MESLLSAEKIAELNETGEASMPGLLKAMSEGRKAFMSLLEKGVGQQLTETERAAIQKAANLGGELKRKEYLESVRSNPANVLIKIFKEQGLVRNPNVIKELQGRLKNTVTRITNQVDEQQSTDSITDQIGKTSTLDYVTNVVGKGQEIIDITYPNNSSVDQEVFKEILSAVDAFPNGEVVSTPQLIQAIRSTSNKSTSGKPFVNNSDVLNNLQARAPGLEGLTIKLAFRSTDSKAFRITLVGDAEFWTRVVEKKPFVPYISE